MLGNIFCRITIYFGYNLSIIHCVMCSEVSSWCFSYSFASGMVCKNILHNLLKPLWLSDIQNAWFCCRFLPFKRDFSPFPRNITCSRGCLIVRLGTLQYKPHCSTVTVTCHYINKIEFKNGIVVWNKWLQESGLARLQLAIQGVCRTLAAGSFISWYDLYSLQCK